MIPLVLLVGFLGSGKTTFLRRLLPLLQEKGLMPAVILNDYQNARVDAALLAELVSAVETVSGSCVCCGSRDEFMALLGTLPLPENGVVLVEANGGTDPVELLEVLAMDPRAARFGPPIQVSLVDAKRWQKRFWHNELERIQVATAAWLCLTRENEVSPVRMAEVRGGLRKLNETAFEIGPEEFADLLLRLQSGGTSRRGENHLPAEKTGHRHSHAFSAVQVSLAPVVTREAMSAWLASLPDRVLRAKGLVAFQEEGGKRYVFQKVSGDAASFLPLTGDTPLEPLAVLIGAGLDEEQWQKEAKKAGIALQG